MKIWCEQGHAIKLCAFMWKTDNNTSLIVGQVEQWANTPACWSNKNFSRSRCHENKVSQNIVDSDFVADKNVIQNVLAKSFIIRDPLNLIGIIAYRRKPEIWIPPFLYGKSAKLRLCHFHYGKSTKFIIFGFS